MKLLGQELYASSLELSLHTMLVNQWEEGA